MLVNKIFSCLVDSGSEATFEYHLCSTLISDKYKTSRRLLLSYRHALDEVYQYQLGL